MEEKILNLVYDYHKSEKTIDVKFIEKLLQSVIDSKGISNYVNGLYINDEYVINSDGNFYLARYGTIDKNIVINMLEIDRIIEFSKIKYSNFLSKDDISILKILMVVHPILHELEHAYQNKLYNLKIDNLEKELVSLVFSERYKYQDVAKTYNDFLEKGMSSQEIVAFFDKKNEIAAKYYFCNPIERMADIKSYETIYNVLLPTKEQFSNVHNIEYYNYLSSLSCGYKDDGLNPICPTEIYVGGRLSEDIIEDCSTYNKLLKNIKSGYYADYPLINRLFFGLPVTKEEYKELKKI